ncbi:MAG TPA: hypothetical protein VGK78_17610 [Nocardioides sp.]|uniref:hypothetical protein n=1 Tax=Nocardioides sp. TaxID=35761 RepID=UPI002F40D663
MTGLQTLLEEAAEHPAEHPAGLDVAADLRRGHRALRRRRARWAALGVTGGLVVAGGATYTALSVHHETTTEIQPTDGPTSSAPLRTTYFDVPTPPPGWHVVGDRPQYVMISRDGSDADLDTFAGQLVVMLSDGKEDYGVGSVEHFDGRTFYVNTENADDTILAVRADDGNWLQLQYPRTAFEVHTMVVYLDGVRLKPGAQPALG